MHSVVIFIPVNFRQCLSCIWFWHFYLFVHYPHSELFGKDNDRLNYNKHRKYFVRHSQTRIALDRRDYLCANNLVCVRFAISVDFGDIMAVWIRTSCPLPLNLWGYSRYFVYFNVHWNTDQKTIQEYRIKDTNWTDEHDELSHVRFRRKML